MRRCFLPKQRDTILQTLCYALRVKSDAALPGVFQLPVAVALKPGSWDELAARFNLPGHRTDPRRMAFDSARALYCRSSQYGHALLTCEHLFSIDMDPDGPPGPADRQLGRELTGQSSHKGPRKTGRAVTAAAAPKPATTSDRGGASAPSDQDGRIAGQPAAQEKPDTAPPRNRTDPKPPLTSTQKRTFHPEQHKQHLRRFCAALAVAEETLPAFLAEPAAVPLKIGTSKDLSQRYGVRSNWSTPERRRLNTALASYCGSFQYQHAILSCDTRFSVDMEPAEPITDDARQHAIERLRERAKRRKARREQPACGDPGS